jgi:hypothetical protein
MNDKNIIKLVTVVVVFLLLTVGFSPVFSAKTIDKINDKKAFEVDDDTEYYALIIGGSVYKNKGNNIPKFPFPPIATWKLKAFYNSILKSPNWKEENIIVLLNEDSTKENITNALEELATKIDSNDIFLFSYQGHGSEVPDEAPFDEEDGTDEIICPYGITQEDGKLINYITDDELNYYLSQINAKGMALIFESCLSGGLVGEEFDVDQENRVVIVSTLEDTIGKASFLIGFPMTFGLAIACNQKFMFSAADSTKDGFISIEEAFRWAVPIIYAELSMYWIALWVFMCITLGDPNTATIQLLIEFMLSQAMAFLISGHFLLNAPHMIDKYPGDLPIIKLNNEAEKTPGLPDEIWEDEYEIPWNLMDKKYWPKFVVEAEIEKKESGLVEFKAYGYNAPKPYKYEWDFGDGNSAEGQYVPHTFAKEGVYDVVLTVTDDAGRIESSTITLEISKSRQKNLLLFDIIERFPLLKSLLSFFGKPISISS